MIDQEPETSNEPGFARTHADRLKLNWVPWTAQQTFRGVLFTLIPWIGLSLLLSWLSGQTTPINKPLSPGDDLSTAIGSIFVTLLIEGAFVIAPLVYASRTLALDLQREGEARLRGMGRYLGLRRFQILRTLPWIIGLMVLIIGADWLYSWVVSALHLNLQTNDQIVLRDSAYEPLTTYALLAGSVVIAPFCEELFFRGFVFAGLLRELSPLWAVIVSAGLFAIAHADIGSFVPLLLIGLALGFLRWRTGSTWASMSLHVLNNLVASVDIILAMHHIYLPF